MSTATIRIDQSTFITNILAEANSYPSNHKPLSYYFSSPSAAYEGIVIIAENALTTVKRNKKTDDEILLLRKWSTDPEIIRGKDLQQLIFTLLEDRAQKESLITSVRQLVDHPTHEYKEQIKNLLSTMPTQKEIDTRTTSSKALQELLSTIVELRQNQEGVNASSLMSVVFLGFAFALGSTAVVVLLGGIVLPGGALVGAMILGLLTLAPLLIVLAAGLDIYIANDKIADLYLTIKDKATQVLADLNTTNKHITRA